MTLDVKKIDDLTVRLTDTGSIPEQAARIIEQHRAKQMPLKTFSDLSFELVCDMIERKQHIADANLADATKNRDACIIANDSDGERFWSLKADEYYDEWLGCTTRIADAVNQQKSMR